MSAVVGNSLKMMKIFPASLDQLYEMLQFVRENALVVGFQPLHLSKIELAAEEALVNIISYGYVNRLGTIEIFCSSPEAITGVKIIIRDHGMPYNPLANAKSFEINAPLEARTIGGCGVFFILTIMDEVEYYRESNMNILILTKYLSLSQ
jgi:serine/threonine-protein kinase RsbW